MWSSKTEAHEGRECRLVPLFPELRAVLMNAFERAAPGGEYVIARYRQRNCNLRTQLLRILSRAGVEPWPRLFHNLRSSRQTELCEAYPIHLVSAWLGNSVAFAQAHYLQVLDAHFDAAAAVEQKYPLLPPGRPDAAVAQSASRETAPKAAQSGAELARTALHLAPAPLAQVAPVSRLATRCGSVQKCEVTPTGSEHPPDFSKKTRGRERGGAISGALGGAAVPSEVRRLVESWEGLPDAVRAGIVAMVEASAPARGGGKCPGVRRGRGGTAAGRS